MQLVEREHLVILWEEIVLWAKILKMASVLLLAAEFKVVRSTIPTDFVIFLGGMK